MQIKEEIIKKRQLNNNDNTNEGRWTREEHDKFLDGIFQYGTNWKKVKTLISTRTIIQVRSHAQKFYMKLKMCKDERLGIDFTSDNITSIKEMIFLIKTKSNNYNIKNIFKYLCDEFNNQKKTKKKNEFQQINNNIGENIINCLFKNNLNINNNNECNSYNNILNLLNINQMNNILLKNNMLFNPNINNNIFDCQNNLFLTNNLNNNNNNSYLNSPFIKSILDKLIFLLRLNNSNIIKYINNSINNLINNYFNVGVNSSIRDSLYNTKVNYLNLNNNPYNNLNNLFLGKMNFNENIFNPNINIFDENFNFQNLFNNNIMNDNNFIENFINRNNIINNNNNKINKDYNNMSNEHNKNIVNLNDDINNSTNYLMMFKIKKTPLKVK